MAEVKAQFNPSTLKAIYNPATEKLICYNPYLNTCPSCPNSTPKVIKVTFSGLSNCIGCYQETWFTYKWYSAIGDLAGYFNDKTIEVPWKAYESGKCYWEKRVTGLSLGTGYKWNDSDCTDLLDSDTIGTYTVKVLRTGSEVEICLIIDVGTKWPLQLFAYKGIPTIANCVDVTVNSESVCGTKSECRGWDYITICEGGQVVIEEIGGCSQ